MQYREKNGKVSVQISDQTLPYEKRNSTRHHDKIFMLTIFLRRGVVSWFHRWWMWFQLSSCIHKMFQHEKSQKEGCYAHIYFYSRASLFDVHTSKNDIGKEIPRQLASEISYDRFYEQFSDRLMVRLKFIKKM